jgi:hypothetical protein
MKAKHTLTVSGQNSNNSVRIPNSFFKALEEDEDWELKARTDGRVMKKVPAKARFGKDILCSMAMRRSRYAVRYYHQRMAYLPERRSYQRIQSLFGIYVPGQYRL